MDQATVVTLGKAGAVAALGLASLGASIGAGIAGSAVIGAWKKAFANGKKALFTLLVFAGCPLSQVIYGMVLMNTMLGKITGAGDGFTNWAAYLAAGIFGGSAIGVCAWYQAIVCASSADALSETGKGFANYLMVMGICETIALFVLVFTMSMAL